jgi:hypothetical protein
MAIGSGGIVEVFLPPGGDVGYVLAKTATDDYAASWSPPGGAGGGIVSLSAGAGTATGPQIVFSNSNGVSFGIAGNTITASAAAGAGGVAMSAGTQSVSTGTVKFADSNGISFGMSGSSQVTASYTVPSIVGLISAIALSAGTTTAALSAVTFSNSNNVSFGLAAGVVTGSASYPAQSVQTQNTVSVQGSTGAISFANSNGITFGGNASTITASYTVPTQSAQTVGIYGSSNTTGQSSSSTVDARSLTFRGMGVASVGLSAGEVIISVPSGGGAGDGGNTLAAGTRTAGSNSVVLFSNLNGVSFGLDAVNGSIMTASHNALTTARASTDAVGLNTAQTNVTWTVNSSGLSLNAAGYAGTGTSATNASITLNSAGLAISVGAPGAATETIYATGNTTVNSSGTIPLSSVVMRGYGILSLGTSNGSLLLSTPDPTVFTQLSVGMSTGGNTAGTTGLATGQLVLAGGANITLSGSTNAGSMTISVVGGAGGGGGGVGVGVSSMGNTAGTTGTVSTGNVVFVGTGPISLSQSSSGSNATISINAPATSSLVAGANITVSTAGSTISIIGASVAAAPVGISAGTVSNTFQTVTFSNSNGISFGLGTGASAGIITGSHNGITTARASTDAIGLNTAQTNVTWTVNSAGLSFNAAGYAGTTSGFTGANISASITHNTAGLALSMSVGAGGGVATETIYAAGNTTVNSSGTFPLSSVQMRGYGILSIGTSNGSLLLSTPDPTVFTQLSVGMSTNGNTAGNTGLATGQFVLAGGANITLSGSTNGNSMTITVSGGAGAGNPVFSAGANSASLGSLVLSNSNGVSFGLNGSTITASVVGGGGGGVGIGLSTMGNTAGTTGMVSTGNVVLVGSGPISLSQSSSGSNATISINAPATSSLVAGANITVSTAGSTISIIGASVAAAPIGISAGTVSNTFQTVTFSNSNGISFGLGTGASAGIITASHNGITTARASTDAIGLNTAQSNVTWTANSSGISIDARGYAGTATGFTGANVSGSMTHNSQGLSLSLSVAPSGGGADGYNILAAGTQTAATTGTVLFNNANGITFGMSNSSVITASHNGLTTARASTDAVGLATAQSNVTWTVNSAGISLDARNYAGVGTSATNASITLNSNGLAISVAAPGAGGGVGLSAGTQSVSTGTVAFANSNGISFGMSGSNQITASYTVPAQSAQSLGLYGSSQTYGQSSSSTIDARSLTFVGSGGVSVGLSGGSYLISGQTTTPQTVQTVGLYGVGNTTGQSSSSTVDARSITFSGAGGVSVGLSGGTYIISGGAGGGAGYTAGVSTGGNTSGDTGAVTGRLILAGGANITLSGSTNAGSMTLSIGAPATSSLSVTGALSISANGSTISMGVQPGGLYASSQTTGQSSSSSYDIRSMSVVGQGIVSVGLSGGSLLLSATQSNQAFSASGGSSAFQTLAFNNGNGATFTNTAGSVGLSYTVPTVTQYFSNTATTFNGTNVSGSITHNTAGIRIDISAGAGGGGVTPVASASNGSFSFTTLGFSNANNVTFGTSVGGIITASVAAPGAAAENNWINLLGANTAGNTTASGSTIGYSGINVTLSGTNGSVINFSAPASSSLSATGDLSISTNGSTISIGYAEPVASVWEPWPLGNNTAYSSYGHNTMYYFPVFPPDNAAVSAIEMACSFNNASSSVSHSVGQTIQYGLYKAGAGASSTQYESISTSQMVIQASFSSNLSGGLTISQGTGSYTVSSAGTGFISSLTGQKHFYLPFATTLHAGSKYHVGFRVSTASVGNTGAFRQSFLVMTNQSNLSWGRVFVSTIFASNVSVIEDQDARYYSATTGGMMASYAVSQASLQVSRARPWLNFDY